MGNLNTPGIIKFFWKNELLETKYETIHQIPVLTLQKKQSYISESSNNHPIAIIHYRNSQKCVQKINSRVRDNPELRVYAVPDQNSKQDFSMISQVNKENMKRGGKDSLKLGKMSLNGQRAHPLFKYLKKNCQQFYSYQTNSSKKDIKGQLGMFVIQNSKDPVNIKIRYYQQQDLDKYWSESNKNSKLTNPHN